MTTARFVPRILALLTLATVLGNSTAVHAKDSAELRSARRELETAEISLHQYVHIDYPLERKRLDREIKVAEATVDSYQRQLTEYEKTTKGLKYSFPLLQTIERVRIWRLQAATEVANLREERGMLYNRYRNQRRLLELAVERAQETLMH